MFILYLFLLENRTPIFRYHVSYIKTNSTLYYCIMISNKYKIYMSSNWLSQYKKENRKNWIHEVEKATRLYFCDNEIISLPITKCLNLTFYSRLWKCLEIDELLLLLKWLLKNDLSFFLHLHGKVVTFCYHSLVWKIGRFNLRLW